MDSRLKSTGSQYLWFSIIALVAVAALAAFWILLSQRYSPENFAAQPITPDVVEFAWFGAAMVGAVCGLVGLSKRKDDWRGLASGAAPLAIGSMLVLAKAGGHVGIRTYD